MYNLKVTFKIIRMKTTSRLSKQFTMTNVIIKTLSSNSLICLNSQRSIKNLLKWHRVRTRRFKNLGTCPRQPTSGYFQLIHVWRLFEFQVLSLRIYCVVLALWNAPDLRLGSRELGNGNRYWQFGWCKTYASSHVFQILKWHSKLRLIAMEYRDGVWFWIFPFLDKKSKQGKSKFENWIVYL